MMALIDIQKKTVQDGFARCKGITQNLLHQREQSERARKLQTSVADQLKDAHQSEVLKILIEEAR